MEEEGIYYFFKHDENEHTMVLGDHSVTHPDTKPMDTARFGEAVSGTLHEDLVTSFRFSESVSQRSNIQNISMKS